MIESALGFPDSIPPAVSLALGVALLLIGGHSLVEGAVHIARRLGVSTLLIGLTVVAFGTSSPELAFNITAAASGNGALSFGNVVGSNLANIGLVLGAVAIITPLDVHSRVVDKELPLLIGVTAAVLGLAWFPLTRLAGAHGFTRADGVLLLGAFAGFAWIWFRLGKRDRADPLAQEAASEAEGSTRPIPLSIVLFVAGLLALVLGGKLAESGAVGIARSLEISEAVIGLTIVAIATSLPELVTTIIAARRGHSDLAIGNVVGSNQFNLLLVLGTTAVVAPVPLPAGKGWWDLALMFAMTVALVPIVKTRARKITRLGGLALLTTYVAYLTYRVVGQYGAA